MILIEISKSIFEKRKLFYMEKFIAVKKLNKKIMYKILARFHIFKRFIPEATE